ncbi:hypothetical protein LINGRAPRIM_LOCUS1973 [Linum grandiflorum]
MFQEERETVNLLAQQQHHQPSYDYDDDAEGEEDKDDDILSLRDLPLTTTSRNWTDPGGHDHHQEDGFEFFSGEFNQEEEEGDIIFCGKIIPYRASSTESSSNFHRRSSSLNNPRGATAVSSLYTRDYSSTHHHSHQVKRFWSLPVSASNGLGDSLRSSDQRCVDSPMKRVSKSRWYVLAFGVEKIPVKMELHDMKFRQSKNFNTNQQVVKQSSSSRKGSLWGLLGILGCNREEASNMVKASFVCIPNV